MVQARFAQGGGSAAISDTLGNLWVQVYNAVISVGQSMVTWYCLGCKGGANTITLTASSANFLRAAIGEWSGVSPLATVKGPSAFTNNASSLTVTTSNITTTGPADLIVALAAQITNFSASATTVNNGFTVEQEDPPNGYDVTIADKTAAAGTINATFTYPSACANGSGIIAFSNPQGMSGYGNLGTGLGLGTAI